MENQPYLLFSLQNARYALEALLVQEIIYLPELTPVIDAPLDIAGILNLRGKVLPVMDLNRRFKHQASDYQLSDSVIIVRWQGFSLGIIVSQVEEVILLDPTQIEPHLDYGRGQTTDTPFIAGIAKLDTEIVSLLNPEALIRYSEPLQLNPDLSDANGHAEGVRESVTAFCPHASPEVRAIFRERAENLRRQVESQEFTGLLPLAVVGLNDEFFGVELDVVREFTDVRKVTPIPCCPDYIVGNMNLRGEIVTLVDIRQVLKMPLATLGQTPKAMVVQVDDIVAGITVDQVFDVMYLHPSEIRAIPTTLSASGEEYLRGTAPYGDKLLSILELPKILTHGELVVDEAI